MDFVKKFFLGLILFCIIGILAFIYYAGAKTYNFIEGNPKNTFNNTIAMEIPLQLLNYYGKNGQKEVPFECNSSNNYYKEENYSMTKCVEALKINETIKDVCLEKQKMIEALVIERREYSKIKLGWISLTDKKVFEISECLNLIN